MKFSYKDSFIGKLPAWGQLIFWGAVIFALYKAYLAYKQWRESRNYKASIPQAQTALNQLSQQGINPSYAQVQYTTWANSLQGAFQGCSGAGDASNFWSGVEPVFKGLKNDADAYALIKAYGVRTIDKCGWLTGDFEGDLSGTLSEKFSGVEGTIIGGSTGRGMAYINDILKKNGLTYQF